MTKYLLDTNVVLRFCNPSDVQHNLATDAISCLLTQGDECFLTAQVLVELWVVATRPVEVNGLGWAVHFKRWASLLRISFGASLIIIIKNNP